MSTPLGADVPRVDGRLKVTGAARYSADHSEDHWGDRLAYAHVVLSTVARGSIRSMDVDAARGAPGVLAVYTPFDPLRIYSASRGETYAPLQDRDVRFRGQVIGLVGCTGRCFGAPGHIRLGFGGPTERLREGLERLTSALTAWPRREG